MRSSSPMRDHSYWEVPSQQNKCDSRLGVKKQFGHLGIEASSPVISENLSSEGNLRDRSVCFHIISSDQALLFVEAGPVEPGSRCLPTKLVPQESLYISPIYMILKALSKILKDQVPMIFFATPAWPSQLWCPEAMRISIQQPISLTWRRDLLKKSEGRNSSSCPKQNFENSGREGLRAKYKRKKFQGSLPTFSLNQEDQVLTPIMNQPGVNGLAGMLKGQLIHFLVI